MTKSKFFRDPLHLQIRFETVDLNSGCPERSANAKTSWALQKIIDTEAFQRLRHIRQNGLANMVFHGAEHSRFSHSMGVSHLARRMYEKLCINSTVQENDDHKLQVAIASLVHDLGHGPFSHTMEEILKENKVPFHHEEMTLRFIRDSNSKVNSILTEIDNALPGIISKFFDKKLRGENDHFIYKIVSSQMDADRLDYVQRDALFCGIRGHGFDMERLLDLIFISENINIAVDRGAIEALEAYLITLDQMWRAVYYHQAVRSSSVMVTNLFKRAFKLRTENVDDVFPQIGNQEHPMSQLFNQGKNISIEVYLRLTDTTIWSLIDHWRFHDDPILKDLSDRIVNRRLLKSIELNVADLKESYELIDRAKEETQKSMPNIRDASDYYFAVDDPTRTSYTQYDWKPETPNNSIWLTGGGKEDCPIEVGDESGIVKALRSPRHFERLFVTEVVKEILTKN